MPEIKHTPGPWSVDNSRHEGSINRMEPFRHIGMVSGYRICSSDHEENQANAKLIAAAPELLEALMAARDLWGDYLPPGNSNAMKAMKLVNAAIAKATQ